MKNVGLLVCLLLCVNAVAQDKGLNIIYVIGDGMGSEYVAAYRYFQDNPSTDPVERTLFDEWLIGTASTSPYDPHQITDSAASATALATGIKTYNGAIGLDIEKQPLETLLQRAKKRGYSTALVATSQINHATPASFAAHTESRKNYAEIADQYFDNRHAGKPYIDLMLGGGRRHFVRDDRNLVAEFQNAGYQYADSLNALSRLNRLPALALVAEDGLPHVIDGEHGHHLNTMTQKALELLDGPDPFFLLVEASQIDWCGHANDIACAMAELADAEATLKTLRDFVEKRPNTLVVVTADHSTGGLSIGADGQYQWRVQQVRAIKASAGPLAEQLARADDWQKTWQLLTDMELSREQRQKIEIALGKLAKASSEASLHAARGELVSTVKTIINRNTHTGWTSGGHTGGDVPLMAHGRNRQRFAGQLDNTEIAQRLFELLPRE